MSTSTRWLVMLTLVLAAPLSAQTFVFEEDFEDVNWFQASAWTKEGAPHDEIEVVQFDDADARLGGASIGSKSGGLSHAAPPNRAGGDNEEVFLDFHMPVPAGEYHFEVTLDQMLYWAEAGDPPPTGQPWAEAQIYYIGDASELDYGSQQTNQPPTGPWLGHSWTGEGTVEDDTRISDTLWNGQCESNVTPGVCGPCGGEFSEITTTCNAAFNAVWRNHTWTEHKDGSTVIDVQDQGNGMGEVILRMTIRHKDDNTAQVSHAMDNVSVTLSSTLPPCNDPWADADGDGDVDQTDFASMQKCLTGADDPGDVFDPTACHCFDRDNDMDVDQSDFLEFVTCSEGPELAPGC